MSGAGRSEPGRLAFLARRPLHVRAWRELSPPQLFVLSFALLVALGTAGLLLLPGLYTGPALGFVDALFTATSAVCVTGLIVVDTATYFTRAGQGFLLLLVQLGGLGLLVLTSTILLTIGRRLSLRHEELIAGPATASAVDLRRLVRSVIRFTFTVEAIGAGLLYLAWIDEFGWTGALWPAVFHAVSAFCNAGFSIFTPSLMEWQEAPVILGVVMALIVLGGLGFLVLTELWGTDLRPRRRLAGAPRPLRLSMSTRLVLVASLIAIAAGWVVFAVFEWSNTLAHLPPYARLVNALFGAITPRTAGFNTVDYAAVSETTAFFTMLLMFAGGAPGSTAGGIKLTTVALLWGVAASRLRGRRQVSAWGRTVPEETVERAVGLTVAAFTVIVVALLALSVTEASATAPRGQFLVHMFEVVSGFATVGLSMGVTPELSPAGRILLTLLMFIGRVGVLTFTAAIAVEQLAPRGFRFAHEDVAIG